MAKSWTQALRNKIYLENKKLTSGEIALFKKVKETFNILSWPSKSKSEIAQDNFRGAAKVIYSICYNAKAQQEDEKVRIQGLAEKAKKELERMSLDKSLPSGSGEIDEDGIEAESEAPFQASELQPKCSKLTKSICSVSVVAVGILLTMLYKYNEYRAEK